MVVPDTMILKHHVDNIVLIVMATKEVNAKQLVYTAGALSTVEWRTSVSQLLTAEMV